MYKLKLSFLFYIYPIYQHKKVKKTAEQLAQKFWQLRNDFVFVAPTGSLEEALTKALESKVHPYFISDSGDNPTAGGAGDGATTSVTILSILPQPVFIAVMV